MKNELLAALGGFLFVFVFLFLVVLPISRSLQNHCINSHSFSVLGPDASLEARVLYCRPR